MLRNTIQVLLISAFMLTLALGQTAEKVQVVDYQESYCPDCRDFHLGQLAPTYEELKDIMDVRINAYGWAQDWSDGQGGYIFDCQHGQEECDGNQIIGCADKYIPDRDSFMDFCTCFMHQVSFPVTPWSDGEECAAKVEADWSTIQTCATSVEGQQIHHDAGVEFNALDPRPIGVPHVTINGEASSDAEHDLKKAVCDAYQGTKPAAC